MWLNTFSKIYVKIKRANEGYLSGCNGTWYQTVDIGKAVTGMFQNVASWQYIEQTGIQPNAEIDKKR